MNKLIVGQEISLKDLAVLSEGPYKLTFFGYEVIGEQFIVVHLINDREVLYTWSFMLTKVQLPTNIYRLIYKHTG
jgi:hypothetical protein